MEDIEAIAHIDNDSIVMDWLRFLSFDQIFVLGDFVF